jgi:hypothetical protein
VHAHIDYQLLNTAPCTTRAPLHPPESRYRPCTAALWNLAYRHNPNRKAIVHAGAIPLLVRLLAPGSSEGARQEAARALSNLSCNNDVGQGHAMVEEGAVPLLVAMMRVGGCGGAGVEGRGWWYVQHSLCCGCECVCGVGGVLVANAKEAAVNRLLWWSREGGWCRSRHALPAARLRFQQLLLQRSSVTATALTQASAATPCAVQSAGPAGKEAAVGAVSNLACIRTHQQAILDVRQADALV